METRTKHEYRFRAEVDYDHDYYGLNREGDPASYNVHTLRCDVGDEINEIVVNVDATPYDQESRGDFPEFLIRAVNSHDALVSAARYTTNAIGAYFENATIGNLGRVQTAMDKLTDALRAAGVEL